MREDVINYINENPPIFFGGEPLTPMQIQDILWGGFDLLKFNTFADLLIDYWSRLEKLFDISVSDITTYCQLIKELIDLDLYDTLEATPEMVYIIDLNFEIVNGINMEDELTKFLHTRRYSKEISKLCSVNGNLVAYIWMSLPDAIKLSKFNGLIGIDDATLGVINTLGEHTEALVDVNINVQFSNKSMTVDGAFSQPYIRNKRFAEGTTIKKIKKNSLTIQSLLLNNIQKDKELETTYLAGGCTLGDKVARRHRHIITDKYGVSYCADCGQIINNS